jgi:hypothetical protein
MTEQRYHHNQPDSRGDNKYTPTPYRKYGGFKNITNQEMFVDEQKEHPSFTQPQIRQIVKDHLAKKHGEKVVEEAEEEDKL